MIAGAEFKLKYSGSALGYVWSVVKPLALFTMLYAVFSHIFKLGAISHYYPVSLLIGIVLFTFFSDATSLGDVVARQPRVAAAQAQLPAARDPDRRHAHGRDHVLHQRRRRARLHRVERDRRRSRTGC